MLKIPSMTERRVKSEKARRALPFTSGFFNMAGTLCYGHTFVVSGLEEPGRFWQNAASAKAVARGSDPNGLTICFQ
ncbi:MAG: hypothetical protein ABL999_01575 [Pyrinomonadaceae bacterium]